MRNKRCFWNMKHHRELDRKMGLSQQMSEPFSSLARACGMSDELEGTHALRPFFLFKIKSQDINRTEPYDVTANDAKRTFFYASAFMGQN